MVVGRLLSFWDGSFLEDMFVFRGVSLNEKKTLGLDSSFWICANEGDQKKTGARKIPIWNVVVGNCPLFVVF